jgi:phosphate starvation-inducible PhoH-like protein
LSSKRRKDQRRKEATQSFVLFKPVKVKPKSKNQRDLLRSIYQNDITFCVGPAGTGKTHVSIGAGVDLLQRARVERIVITRPILEVGQGDRKSNIGYLPGTIDDKLGPYLRPLHDELAKFLNQQGIAALKASSKIEICPIEFMRGRTFENTYIICDESQNATEEQLEMLLTRLGNGSKMVVSGDVDQCDLSSYRRGGFENVIDDLDGLAGLGIIYLETCDVARHPLVAAIIERRKAIKQNLDKPATLMGLGYDCCTKRDEDSGS